jgi:hypothetical protein
VYNIKGVFFIKMSTKLQAKLRCEKENREFIDETLSSIGRTSADKHYVKNSVLYAEMKKCIEEGKCSDQLCMYFYNIATRLSNKMHYNDEDDRADCIQSAVMDCVKYYNRFKPEITTNAFAYITSICTNGFAKGWRSLGKMKCPDSLKLSISTDNLYSI